MILAGDIGGTKTNIALFNESELLHFATFPSQSYKSLESLVEEYLQTLPSNTSLDCACFAVAGPVVHNVCKATNLPWIVDAQNTASTLNVSKVFLINDLLANATAIEIMPPECLVALQNGKTKGEGNRAIVSPGTGLGEAGLFWDGQRFHPFSSEGGHADFAPIDALQVELFQYLHAKFEHVSYERVLSGPGFNSLFEFFIEVKHMPYPTQFSRELKGKDLAVAVTQHALNGTEQACVATLDLFVDILAQECGNTALKWMALGGVYIGGGIAPKIISKLKEKRFIKSFLRKGRFDHLLGEVPIYVILDDKASLKGAAYYATKQQYSYKT